jgi:hypothetical protein
MAPSATQPMVERRSPYGAVKRATRCRNSYDAMNPTEATLRQTCLSQVVVGLSALASTAVLLVQVLPPLMHGFP